MPSYCEVADCRDGREARPRQLWMREAAGPQAGVPGGKRRPAKAMPTISAMFLRSMASRCRVRERPAGRAIWMKDRRAAQADVLI
jgi:hypothetical protein